MIGRVLPVLVLCAYVLPYSASQDTTFDSRLNTAVFTFYPTGQSPLWSDALGFLDALQQHGGHRVRVYNFMGHMGAFVEPDPELGTPGGIRGLTLGCIAQFSIDLQQGYKPDVVLVLDFGSYRSKHLGRALYPPALWVLEAGDDPQQFPANSLQAPRYDVVLTPDLHAVDAYEAMARAAGQRRAAGAVDLGSAEGGPYAAHWVTHFAGLYARDISHYLRQQQQQKQQQAREAVEVVTSCGDRDGIPDVQAHFGARMLNGRARPGLPHHTLLASGRVVVNKAKHGEVTRRIFEAMLTGRPVVTDRLEPARGLEQDLLLYDDAADAVRKVEYLLANPEMARAIGRRGQLKVLQHHTASARVAQVDALLRYHLLIATGGVGRGVRAPDAATPPADVDGARARTNTSRCTTLLVEAAGDVSHTVRTCREESMFRAAAAFCEEHLELTVDCVVQVGEGLAQLACKDPWCPTPVPVSHVPPHWDPHSTPDVGA